MAALFGGIIVGGIVHFLLGFFINKIRHWLPPLVTGLIVLTIGLTLLPVGIKYAAGGVTLLGKPEFGSFLHWGLALLVIVVTLGIKFFTRGILSSAGILIGLVTGYVAAVMMGIVNFGGIAKASWFMIPEPFKFGIELQMAYGVLNLMSKEPNIYNTNIDRMNSKMAWVTLTFE